MRLYTFLQELYEKVELDNLLRVLTEQGHHLSANDLKHLSTICKNEKVQETRIPMIIESLLYVAEVREDLNKPHTPMPDKNDDNEKTGRFPWLDWFSFF